MRLLSYRTVGLAARFVTLWIAPYYDKPDELFQKLGISRRLVEEAFSAAHYCSDPGKASIVEVFHYINEVNPELLLKIIKSFVTSYPGLDWEAMAHQQALYASVQRDGFDPDRSGNFQPFPLLEESFERTEYTVRFLLAQSKQDVNYETLLDHLDQHSRLYHEPNSRKAAIGEARNFLELLLEGLASTIATKRGQSVQFQRPVQVRQYLEAEGFATQVERRNVLDASYGFLSDVGSHPGVPDQASCRLARGVFFATLAFILEKWNRFRQSLP